MRHDDLLQLDLETKAANCLGSLKGCNSLGTLLRGPGPWRERERERTKMICTCVYIYTYTCAFGYIHVYTCRYTHMYMYMCIKYVCIWASCHMNLQRLIEPWGGLIGSGVLIMRPPVMGLPVFFHQNATRIPPPIGAGSQDEGSFC